MLKQVSDYWSETFPTQRSLTVEDMAEYLQKVEEYFKCDNREWAKERGLCYFVGRYKDYYGRCPYLVWEALASVKRSVADSWDKSRMPPGPTPERATMVRALIAELTQAIEEEKQHAQSNS